MLTHYFVLNVPFDASDEDIRTSYLQLVKKHPPEKDPTKFQQITESYEAIKNERRRVAAKLSSILQVKDYEAALFSLAKAREVKRRRAKLHELFQAETGS